MKKIALYAAAFMFCLPSAYAAQYGIGFSLTGDDEGYIIRAPINVTKEFRVEPFLSYDSESEDERGTPYHDSWREIELGSGFFNVRPVNDKTNLIIGGRISYFEGAYKDSGGYEDHNRGYAIAPVLGFEYFLIDNLSLGGEVSLEYYNRSSTNDCCTSYDYSGTETQTELNIKYYFN